MAGYLVCQTLCKHFLACVCNLNGLKRSYQQQVGTSSH